MTEKNEMHAGPMGEDDWKSQELVNARAAAIHFKERAEKAEAELAALRAAAASAELVAWQPIETAPKNGNEVDLWCHNISQGSTDQIRAPDMWWDCEIDRWVDHNGCILEQKWRLTHWMLRQKGPSANE